MRAPIPLAPSLALVGSLLASAVWAKPPAPGLFCQKYPTAPSCSGQTASCLTCHVAPPELNAFGQDVRGHLGGETQPRPERRYLFVIGATGGASIIDSFLPVREGASATGAERTTFADSLVVRPSGSNLDCVSLLSSELSGREKQRPTAGAMTFGTGHHLNNGVVLISPRLKGNRVYGGVDPDTCLTYGFDRVTGAPAPGTVMGEGDVYSAICAALGVDFSGRASLPAMIKA